MRKNSYFVLGIIFFFVSMDIEDKQAELIKGFAKEASVLDDGPSLEALVQEATSHPALFAFSEILSVPTIAKVRPVSLILYFFLWIQ